MLLTYFDILPRRKPPWNLKVYIVQGRILVEDRTPGGPGAPFFVLHRNHRRTYRQLKHLTRHQLIQQHEDGTPMTPPSPPPLTLRYITRKSRSEQQAHTAPTGYNDGPAQRMLERWKGCVSPSRRSTATTYTQFNKRHTHHGVGRLTPVKATG